MQRQTITIDKKTYDVPRSWNDLSPRDLHKCYAAVMTDTLGAIEPEHAILLKKQLLIELLFGLNEKELLDYKANLDAETTDERDFLFYSSLKKIYDLLMPAFFQREDDPEDNETPEQYSIKLGLTQNPYKTLKRDGGLILNKGGKKNTKTYHAPADELDNLTIYEMSYAFSAFEAWIHAEEGEEKNDLLDYLIAVIYREAKPPTRSNRDAAYQGDIRQPLLHMEATIVQRQKKMKQIDNRVKQIIAFWFASCRQKIVDENAEIFKVPTGEQNGPNFGWGGLLTELAGGIVHLDEVSKQPYQNAFLYLKQNEAKRIASEERAKK